MVESKESSLSSSSFTTFDTLFRLNRICGYRFSILNPFTRAYNINMILIICWLTCHWISKLTSRTHTKTHATPTWHEIQLPISIYFHFFHLFIRIFDLFFPFLVVSCFTVSKFLVSFGFCRSVGRAGHRAISILISCLFWITIHFFFHRLAPQLNRFWKSNKQHHGCWTN